MSRSVKNLKEHDIDNALALSTPGLSKEGLNIISHNFGCLKEQNLFFKYIGQIVCLSFLIKIEKNWSSQTNLLETIK